MAIIDKEQIALSEETKTSVSLIVQSMISLIKNDILTS